MKPAGYVVVVELKAVVADILDEAEMIKAGGLCSDMKQTCNVAAYEEKALKIVIVDDSTMYMRYGRLNVLTIGWWKERSPWFGLI